MEFVVMVIQRYFHRTLAEATRIMLAVHEKGKGVCGLYPYDIATTKVVQVTDFAIKNEMPLKCTMEKIE
jgi:ATP-dependent Clp protease adaptor protein ClpS